MKKILKGSHILISAGPVWSALDKVRVITNIFGGSLGLIIAKQAYQMGACVTLLMGPGRVSLPKCKPKFQIIRFKYFDEILKLVIDEVNSKKYNVFIHSAAVSDYKPKYSNKKKIKSGKNNLLIRLTPTTKIVNLIKKIDNDIFLVKFKLEVNNSDQELIKKAYNSLIESNAELIVANDFKTVSRKHKGFIIDKDKKIIRVYGKEKIAYRLLQIISSRLKRRI